MELIMQEEDVYSSRITGQENFVNTTGLKLPRKYISASQITSYQICPMTYYWNYIENKRESMGIKATVGVAGHNALEMLSTLGDMDFTEEELRQQMDISYASTLEDTPKDLKTGDNGIELLKYKEKMFASMRYYASTEFKKLKVVAREVQVDAAIPIYKTVMGNGGLILEEEKLGDVTVAGFIDFVNYTQKGKVSDIMPEGTSFKDVCTKHEKSLEIGDYKTSAIGKDYKHFMGDVQTAFYSFATGIKKVRIDNITPASVRFTKSGAPYKNNTPPSYTVLRHNTTQSDIGHMQRQIANTVIAIGSGAFTMCHPSYWKCTPNMCGHWEYCRGKNEQKYIEGVAAEKHQDIR
jgi:hypothetical protein